MDKNSVIGFILIALILFGFTFFQSRQNTKRMEAQRIQDSIALANMPHDSLAAAAPAVADALQGQPAVPEAAAGATAIYADSLLEAAYNAEAAVATLENELVKLEFTSKGAQPYSAQLKKYSSYGGGDLMLLRGGDAE
jgi:YidC/Oxa1 family membrane protein insertase